MDSYQLRFALLSCIDDFTAVCAVDQLREIKQTSFFIVCNNQKSSESGMHWLAFHKTSQSSTIEFFDSFGFPLQFYPKEMYEFCMKNGSSLEYSSTQFQSNLSDVCGNFCLYFLIKRFQQHTYEEILKGFETKNKLYNDTIVTNFVRENFDFPPFSDCETFCQKECIKRGIDFSGVCIQQNKTCRRLNNSLRHNINPSYG